MGIDFFSGTIFPLKKFSLSFLEVWTQMIGSYSPCIKKQETSNREKFPFHLHLPETISLCTDRADFFLAFQTYFTHMQNLASSFFHTTVQTAYNILCIKKFLCYFSSFLIYKRKNKFYTFFMPTEQYLLTWVFHIHF